MSFVTGQPEKTEITPRSDGHLFPSVPGQEIRIPLPGCAACPKQSNHGSPCSQIGVTPVFGQSRSDLVPSASRIDADFLDRVQSDMWRMGSAVNGPVGLEFIFNLGVANNMMQNVNYEVTNVDATNPRRIRLKGPDPRALPVSIRRLNPEWPFDGPRIIADNETQVLPLGSFVLFNFPSALHRKMSPWIEEIEVPSGTLGEEKTFWVTLSRSVKSAREPWDAAFPADVYTCTVLAYLIAPEALLNVQPSQEAQFVEIEQQFVAADLDGSNRLELLDSAGQSTRVLMSPQFGPNLIRLSLDLGLDDPVPVAAAALLSTDDTGTGWESHLDLSAWTDGLVGGTVRFWAEAVDEYDEPVVNVRGRCINSQRDSNGYGEDGEYRCFNTSCSKFQRGDYRAECWDTPDNATGFSVSSPAFRVGDFSRSQFGGYWTRENLILRQGLPGSASSRNFSFTRPGGGGPSLQQMIGRFCDILPSSPGQARVEPWFTPLMGQRRVYTNNDGDLTHELVHGLFETNRSDFDGAIEETLGTAWTNKDDARGVQADAVNGLFPLFHTPPLLLPTRQTGSDPAASFKIARERTEIVHITNLDPDEVNNAVATSIRSALP